MDAAGVVRILIRTLTNPAMPLFLRRRWEYTVLRHPDLVAIRFPDVRIVTAHLRHPYQPECVAVIRKHPNVYADVSALHYRPFQLYNSLILVREYG